MSRGSYHQEHVVYIKGSMEQSRAKGHIMWYDIGYTETISITGNKQTHNVAEIQAAMYVVKQAELKGWRNVTIRSKNKYVPEIANIFLVGQTGYRKMKRNSGEIRELVAMVRSSRTHFTFEYSSITAFNNN
eukprot:TRINITY_DN40909_c0_g1_i1.p1 TRINITY_DN40909_c0_g1~~TRINITY_DN40909_c0_g1_i1.p1  ORF type:complete len:131 (-),score=29.63 TRINITY_DN40909_c0_g1_i1:374-766(-)